MHLSAENGHGCVEVRDVFQVARSQLVSIKGSFIIYNAKAKRTSVN